MRESRCNTHVAGTCVIHMFYICNRHKTLWRLSVNVYPDLAATEAFEMSGLETVGAPRCTMALLYIFGFSYVYRPLPF